MAPFWSFLALLMIFMGDFISVALQSQVHEQFSTISAAPALLPGPPLTSSPSLSPDIEPLFPTPKGVTPSPSDSSLPTIPSSPSPPNPEDIPAPGPEVAFPPSGVKPVSSTVSLSSSGPQFLVIVLSLLVFWLMQLSGSSTSDSG
ncbi:hypothetical protein CFOL_v3_22544 [Cephalotus follicularis]|uniref:Uncharacterized protein n=1 Tax=Cephalotus follicularis TaxID=3775 RepID=A0A1Q3CFS5_CEPFO|nr:hypothetical protein CFOL_v3_22544 [Cephalotus follicularis]